MRRIGAVAAAVLVLAGCSAGSGNDERVVLVDYSVDNVSSFIAQNFPKRVEITAGQTVVFKQTWTGEPHTVTGGMNFNEKLQTGSAFIDFFVGYDELRADNDAMVNPESPGDATIADTVAGLRAARPKAKANAVLAAYASARKAHPNLPDFEHPSTEPFSVLNDALETESADIFEGFPFVFEETAGEVAQNVGQPCYLPKGSLPLDAMKPCAKTQQRQPDFDGTQAVYNSGIIPYDGPRGNTFRLKFAPDTKPGSYFFFCAVHGLGQLSEIVVRPAGTKVPSASAVRRQGVADARKTTRPLERTYRDAVRTNKVVDVSGETVSGPFGGLPTDLHASIDEFVPRELRVKVNEPISWKLMGTDHTISFNVPPYLPIIQFGKTFRMNPKIENEAGGAPKPPDTSASGSDDDDSGDEPREPVKIDGGTFDGEGFWSTGLVGAEPYLEYTLRISKKGTYNYACLIHPRMVGKLIVS